MSSFFKKSDATKSLRHQKKKAEPNDPAFVVVYLILFGCLFLKLPPDPNNTD